MKTKIIQYLKLFRRKFKKLYNTLEISDEKNIPEVISSILRKLMKRKVGTEGKNFLDLLEHLILPNFWLKLGKNTLYKLRDYFYFMIFLACLQLTPESGSDMLKIASILGPDADSFLYHLSKFTAEDIQEITEKLNAVIFRKARQYFRRGFYKKAFPVAIDYTNQPFYGDRSTLGVVGGKKKAGTSWFYCFAALTIIQPHVRFTLAVSPVLPFDRTVEIVQRLVQKAEQVIKIKYVEADRGFFRKEVTNFFIRHGYQFLMPVIKNDRIKEKIIAVHEGKIGPSFLYQFKNKKSEHENEVFTVFLIKAKNTKTTSPQKKRKKPTVFDFYHGFATNQLKRKPSAKQLQQMADQYRERWGVETGFKMKKYFQIKTASKKFVVRSFCFLFSVVIYNLWILSNLLFQSKKSNRYRLPAAQVKMLLLLKALGIFTAILDEKLLKLARGDSP